MDLADGLRASGESVGVVENIRANARQLVGAPALFRLPRSAEWVRRALLDRCLEVWLLMQPRPSARVDAFAAASDHEWMPLDATGLPVPGERIRSCPLGAPGALAWVAESHWRLRDPAHPLCLDPRDGRCHPVEGVRIYEGAACLAQLPSKGLERALWSSMPLWATRLVLRTQESAPRRLHSITATEAMRAGFLGIGESARTRFLADFEAAHGPQSAGDDPWMWRVCFEPADARGAGALNDSGVAQRKGLAARKLRFAKTVIE